MGRVLIFSKCISFFKRIYLCYDSIRLFDWMQRHKRYWWFYINFRYRLSPLILEDVYNLDVDLDEKGRLYALAISHFKIDDVFKTTGLKRTKLADQMLLSAAKQVENPLLMEIGVSDGSSAVELYAHSSSMDRLVLTDRFSRFFMRDIPFGKVFYDAEKRPYCIKFLCFVFYPFDGSLDDTEIPTTVEVVNPILRERYGIRAITRFNMFKDALGEPVDIIKCSNVLNKVYFSDDEARRAIENISRSLKLEGMVVVSQNNEKYKDGEACFLLKKTEQGFRVVDSVNDHDFVGLFRRVS